MKLLWRTVAVLALFVAPGFAQSNRVPGAIINNVHFAMHSIFVNPKFVDGEIGGSLRVKTLVEVGGFLSLVPHSHGFGGTHYGEIQTGLRVLRHGSFSIGPAHEHVGLSRLKDYEKLGIAGGFTVGRAFFSYEAYAYSSRPKANNLGMVYNIPLVSGWSASGFVDYLIRSPRQPRIIKGTLRRRVRGRAEFLIEYFHNDLTRPEERNKISAGFGYKLK